MNRNVTASFSLSVSLVVLFAVLLYQPDSTVPPTMQAATIVRAASGEPISNVDRRRPELTPGIPLPESAAGNTSRHKPSPSPTARGEAIEHEVVGDRARPSSGGSAEEKSSSPAPVPPPSAFTHAKPGESLTDIAIRVYGSPDSARKVWMANRDLIDSLDAIPPDGTLLRTP